MESISLISKRRSGGGGGVTEGEGEAEEKKEKEQVHVESDFFLIFSPSIDLSFDQRA